MNVVSVVRRIRADRVTAIVPADPTPGRTWTCEPRPTPHYRRRAGSHRAEGSDRREPETLDVARVRLEAAAFTRVGGLVGVAPQFVSALRATRRCAELNSPCWDDSPYCFLNCQGSLRSDTAAHPLLVHPQRDQPRCWIADVSSSRAGRSSRRRNRKMVVQVGHHFLRPA
jgi:hypothetical protein